MREKPILFSLSMVRALLDGRKTQTRRVLKQAVGPSLSIDCDDLGVAVLSWLYGDGPGHDVHERIERVPCPYGVRGDRLWVREAWRTTGDGGRADYMPPRDLQPHAVWYDADGTAPLDECVGKRRPGMFMPRWASRITLEVTGVRVERLQDISEQDAIAEGIETDDYFARQEYFDCVAPPGSHGRPRPIPEYQNLWDSLNAERGCGWDTNPWAWVVEFKRVNE